MFNSFSLLKDKFTVIWIGLRLSSSVTSESYEIIYNKNAVTFHPTICGFGVSGSKLNENFSH